MYVIPLRPFHCDFIRTSPEFQKLLGIAMEMFLLCSDDKESDVRMVADECLNKIIKVSHAHFIYLIYINLDSNDDYSYITLLCNVHLH